MSAVSVACPHCGQAVSVDPSLSGQAVACPNCRGRFQLPGAAAADWFVRRRREVRGPFRADQLRELARRGRIRADDLVRQGGDQRWFNAASIPGLLQAPAARPAAPPAIQATPGGNMAALGAPAIQPRQPATAPRRVLLAGGGMILWERGTFSFDFGGDSEASARAALSIGGVQEYLVVVLFEKEIRWHELVDGRYRVVPPDADGLWRSRVFPGPWLDGKALLAGDLRQVLDRLQDGLRSPDHENFVAQLAARREAGK